MGSFRFRKKTDYGLMMMGLLARKSKGEYLSVHEMQDFGLPRSFLVKIARDLIRASLIQAKEGRSGGYFLVRSPNEVTIKMVVEALEGSISTGDCSLHGKKCPLTSKCPHRIVMMKMSDELSDVLAKYRLSDFEKA